MNTTTGKLNSIPAELVGMGKFRAGETAPLRIDEKMQQNLVVDFRENAVDIAIKTGNVELAEFIVDSLCKSLSKIIENLKPPETENKDLLERKLEKLEEHKKKLELKEENFEELMEKIRIETEDLQKWFPDSVVVSCDASFV